MSPKIKGLAYEGQG